MISSGNHIDKIIKQYNSLSLQSRAAIWFVICNILVKGFNFFSAPIFASLLSSDQYGIVSVYNAYQQILVIFATLELYLGAYNKGYIKYNTSLNEFTFSLISLSNLVTIVLFAFMLLMRTTFERYTQLGSETLVLSFVMFFVQPAFYCWISKCRYEYRYLNVVAVSLAFSFFILIIPIFANLIFKPTAEVKINATLIASIIIYLPFYSKILRENLNKKSIRKMKLYWKYCLIFQMPLVIHSLSFLILGQSDRIMISKMVSNSAAGIYSVSYTVASLALVLQASINQAYQPFRYRCLKDKKLKEFAKSTNVMLFVLGMLITVFSLIAPEIVKLLFSEEYQEAIVIIPPIIISAFFMCIYSVFVDVETYYEKTRYVMYVSCICAVLNIVLNYFAIIHWGYLACGFTTLISYIVFAFLHFVLMKKVIKDKGIDIYFIDYSFIAILSCITLFMGIMIMLLYDYYIIRYMLLAIFISIVVIKKDAIKKMLMEFK